MSQFAVTAEGLTKHFSPPGGWRKLARNRPTTAVQGVNLAVEYGEIFGLLGPNGAGKTTLVKMLTTLILPSSGTASVAGHSLEDPAAIRADASLIVSDERSFYWRITAQQNLEFFASLYGFSKTEATQRATDVLHAVNLADRGHERFSGFSSGMKQRMAIARGLLNRPKVLFLDEPSRSLDPVATKVLHDLVRALVTEQNVTIFLITHDMAEAEKLCDRVAVMHQGSVQVEGKPAELRAKVQPYRSYALTLDGHDDDAHTALTAHVDQLERTTNGVAFRVPANSGAFDNALATLRAHDVAVVSVESRLPTLEEVFSKATAT